MQGSREAEKGPQSWTAHPCLTHPEDVIDEESAKQDAASAHVVQVQKLYPIKGEGQAKEVVGNPVLGKGWSETSSLCSILPCLPSRPPAQALTTYLPQQVPDTNDAA